MAKSVLVLEDEHGHMNDLAQALDQAGYVLRFISEGDDGLAELFDEEPGVIFLSLLASNAIAVCESIRNKPEGVITPIIFIGTGKESITSAPDALAQGGDFYFELPLDLKRVIARVQTYAGVIETPVPAGLTVPELPDFNFETSQAIEDKTTEDLTMTHASDALMAQINAAEDEPNATESHHDPTLDDEPAVEGTDSIVSPEHDEAQVRAQLEMEVRQQMEAEMAAEEDIRVAQENEERIRLEREAEAKAEAERVRLEAEAEARAEAENEERIRLEREAEAKAEAERVRLEAEAAAKAEAENEERIRLELEAEAKAEAERVRLEIEAAAKAEAENEERIRLELEAEAKAEAERVRLEAEAEQVQHSIATETEAAMRLRIEAEVRAKLGLPKKDAASNLPQKPPAAIEPFGVRGTRAAKGNFTQTDDPANLIFDCLSQRITGCLSLVSHNQHRSIYFDRGAPVGAASDDPYDKMEEFLYREGRITRAHYQQVRIKKITSPRKIGAYLVAEGFLKPKELFPAVRGHAMEIIFGVFEFDAGTYHISNETIAEDDRVILEWTPAALIVEGIRRKYLLERLMARVGSPATLLSMVDGALGLEALGLTPDEMRITRLVDGTRSIEDIVFSSSMGEQPVYATLAGLLVCERAQVLVSGLGSTEDGAARADSIDTQRIREKVDRVHSLDYFQILGVSRTATSYEVDLAFDRNLKEFAPQRFSEQVRQEFHNDLLEIQRVLEDAHHVLHNASMRDAYARNLTCNH